MGEDGILTSIQHEKNVAETAASQLGSVYQNDGLHRADLRIDGDDADHDHETPVCLVRHEESAFLPRRFNRFLLTKYIV